MRFILTFSSMFFILLMVIACNPENGAEATVSDEEGVTETTEDHTTEDHTEAPDAATEEYLKLDADMPMADYEGEKVIIKGSVTNDIMEHMMKPSDDPFSSEAEPHVYINLNGGAQIVGYHKGIDIPQDGERLFYGTVGKVSGAGKGGGMHTEYYLDLDKVE